MKFGIESIILPFISNLSFALCGTESGIIEPQRAVSRMKASVYTNLKWNHVIIENEKSIWLIDYYCTHGGSFHSNQFETYLPLYSSDGWLSPKIRSISSWIFCCFSGWVIKLIKDHVRVVEVVSAPARNKSIRITVNCSSEIC